MKRFFKKADGFTLVELVVVIAILGVLAGVGTVGYSGYVKKANMAADETLVRDMTNAATIALYNDYAHQFRDTVVIKLSADGAAVIEPSSGDDYNMVNAAMIAAFGDNWAEVCKLSYSDWKVIDTENIEAFKNTSLFGDNEKMNQMLNQMGNLSKAMTVAFGDSNTENFPEEIKNAIAGTGVSLESPVVKANAAVLSLAETLGGNESVRTDVNAVFANAMTLGPTGISSELQNIYKEVYKDDAGNFDDRMVLLATAATMYSYAECFAQYENDAGNDAVLRDLHGMTFDSDDTTYEIFDKIGVTFGGIMGNYPTQMSTWYAAKGDVDATAMFTVFDGLKESSDVLKNNLTSDTFYTDGSAANLLEAYLALDNDALGDGIAAAVIVTKSKGVSAVLGGLR